MKLPSEPPPTATPCNSGRPISRATSTAIGNNHVDAVGGIGGRLKPPLISSRASGFSTFSEFISASTRSRSTASTTRTSIEIFASAGTTLSAVPTTATVGVTVVPSSAFPKVLMRKICADASTRALTPFSGSRPACEARPSTCNSNVPVPLRAVFKAPPSALGSRTKTAPQALARSTMRSRE